MSEYATVLEVWFEADSDERANEIAEDLASQIMEAESVHLVECARVESTE